MYVLYIFVKKTKFLLLAGILFLLFSCLHVQAKKINNTNTLHVSSNEVLVQQLSNDNTLENSNAQNTNVIETARKIRQRTYGQSLPVSEVEHILFNKKNNTPFDTGISRINIAVINNSLDFLVSFDSTLQLYEIQNSKLQFKKNIPVDIPSGFYIGGVDSFTYTINEKTQTIIALIVSSQSVEVPGRLYLFDLDGTGLLSLTLGSTPSDIQFSPDGKYLVVINQGKASDDYSINPQGSVQIFTIKNVLRNKIEYTQLENDFSTYKMSRELRTIEVDSFLRATADLQPHSLAIDDKSMYAYVTLPANDAIAKIMLSTGKFVFIKSLGARDERVNGVDVVNDGFAEIKMKNVRSLYMPTDIIVMQSTSMRNTIVVTANTGWIRNYSVFSDFKRLNTMELEPAYPGGNLLLEMTPNLLVSSLEGDRDTDGRLNAVFIPGSRSVSFWSQNISLMSDSGTQIAEGSKTFNIQNFNTAYNSNTIDSASESFGSRPRALALGQIGKYRYLFTALQNTGDIAIFNVSQTPRPLLVNYVQASTRNYNNTYKKSFTNAKIIKFISTKNSAYAYILVGFDDVLDNELQNNMAIKLFRIKK